MTRVYTLQVQTQPHKKEHEYDRIIENLAGWSMDEKKKGRISTNKWALTESLKECVRRSRQGDLQAMEELYHHFRTPLYGLAYRYTYNHVSAEDLLQDIFIKIFTRLKRLDNVEAFTGWMYKVAINTCLSHLRSANKPAHKTVSLEDIGELMDGSQAPIPDKLLTKPIDEAIKSLSPKLKSVFLLHDVQGFKHQEIAQFLGCSVGTSKSQLFKARIKIRNNLKKNK